MRRVISYRPGLGQKKLVKFVKSTPKEAKEIETAVKRTDKSGKWTSAEELLKNHKIR